MLCPPMNQAPLVLNWLERHRHPVSFALHVIGIPLTLIGVLLVPFAVCLVSIPILAFSVGLFVVGYLIQFLGHAAEGSEPGEITALRRWVRRSTQATAHQPSSHGVA